MLKHKGQPIVQWLTWLSYSIWHSAKVIKDWREQLVIPLHKEGDYDACDSFRGIALLSIPGKIFCRVSQSRFKEKADQWLRENQSVSGKEGDMEINCFYFDCYLNGHMNFANHFLYFVDQKKVCDSVNREVLWTVLQEKYHQPLKLLRILKATQGAMHIESNPKCCEILWESIQGVPHQKSSSLGRCVGAKLCSIYSLMLSSEGLCSNIQGID